ncbi:MAG: metal-dependent hydrolase [Acidimicrobiia bacterium]|nr:metal-dependent hydrolase [Acidimicrobiia bacterium]
MVFQDVEATWLGHAAFRFRLKDGTVILVDPWLEGNPACPEAEHTQERVDAIYLTHGHFDHFGDTLALAERHGPQIFCNHEISIYLEGQGVDNVVGLNIGGAVEGPGGVTGILVNAVHSSGISGGDGIVDGGDPGGWVLHLPDGPTVYHAGDTAVFGDMALIHAMHDPDVALLPIGGHFTMDPRGAARAALLVDAPTVVPIHYGTFPILAGTPEDLAGELESTDITVVTATPGEPI